MDDDAVLSLLGDDHARAVLGLLGEEPLPACEIADRLDLSRATVYRRLNRLESAGLVTSSVSVHPDGHHRKRFRAVVDGARLAFDTDGISVELTPATQ